MARYGAKGWLKIGNTQITASKKPPKTCLMAPALLKIPEPDLVAPRSNVDQRRAKRDPQASEAQVRAGGNCQRHGFYRLLQRVTPLLHTQPESQVPNG